MDDKNLMENLLLVEKGACDGRRGCLPYGASYQRHFV